jgi:hypothetical protein
MNGDARDLRERSATALDALPAQSRLGSPASPKTSVAIVAMPLAAQSQRQETGFLIAFAAWLE